VSQLPVYCQVKQFVTGLSLIWNCCMLTKITNLPASNIGTSVVSYIKTYKISCLFSCIFNGSSSPFRTQVSYSILYSFFTDGRAHWTSDQLVTRPLPKYRTTQTQNKRIHIRSIHVLSGIRIHDASVRASKDSSRLRLRGYCDRYFRMYYTHTHTHTHTHINAYLSLGPSLRTFEPGLCSRYSDWLRAEWPRGRNSSPGGSKNFHFSTSSRPTLGPTQPSIQWTPGTISLGVKGPAHEADHSPPPSAEVKKTWVCTSTPLPPIGLHGVVLN
jgi:hypothetical protein